MATQPSSPVAALAERTELAPERVELILSALAEVVVQALSNGQAVDLAGVGQLAVRHEPPRRVTDGETGAVLLYPPRNVVHLQSILNLSAAPQQEDSTR